jgi:hypothetical protein
VRDGHIELWTDEGWERFMTALTRAGSEWQGPCGNFSRVAGYKWPLLAL